MSITQYPYFISWSGGKDSCLAFHRSVQRFGKPKFLLTMLTEDGDRSRSHGLKKAIIQAQANSLGVEVLFCSATCDNYEDAFIKALHTLKAQGIEGGVFGDIKIENHPDWIAHCQWAENVCSQAKMVAHEPLWNDTEESLVSDFLTSGIRAEVIAVKATCLDKKYLGKPLIKETIDEFIQQGVHPLGETGEYHTVVINSPLFSIPLTLLHKEKVLKDGYWFLDADIK